MFITIDMVSLESSISVRNSTMSESDQANLEKSSAKSRNMKTPSSTGGQKIKPCDQCQFAIVDFVMLIAMVGALGLLLFPYAKIVTLSCAGIVGVGLRLIKEEISYDPGLYRFLGLVMVCAIIVGFILMVLIIMCTKCGRPGCKGLRKGRALEVQVLTEEDLRGSSNGPIKDVVKVGPDSMPPGVIAEMMNRVRKSAPPNGKVVLIHRAGCGCVAGRVEVAGPRTLPPRGRIKK